MIKRSTKMMIKTEKRELGPWIFTYIFIFIFINLDHNAHPVLQLLFSVLLHEIFSDSITHLLHFIKSQSIIDNYSSR